MSITITAFVLVLVLGIVAIIVALTRENPLNSTFFYLTAFWVTCLAHLSPGLH